MFTAGYSNVLLLVSSCHSDAQRYHSHYIRSFSLRSFLPARFINGEYLPLTPTPDVPGGV
jgi:hypothetical protein